VGAKQQPGKKKKKQQPKNTPASVKANLPIAPEPDKPPPTPPPPALGSGSQDDGSQKPWWYGLFRWCISHRPHSWVWLLFVVLATVITLEEGYPWLSISKDEALNERNPYQTMFYVTNEGYFPALDLRSTCTEGMVDSARNDINFNTGGDPERRGSKNLRIALITQITPLSRATGTSS
jgi:hypothetical protein